MSVMFGWRVDLASDWQSREGASVVELGTRCWGWGGLGSRKTACSFNCELKQHYWATGGSKKRLLWTGWNRSARKLQSKSIIRRSSTVNHTAKKNTKKYNYQPFAKLTEQCHGVCMQRMTQIRCTRYWLPQELRRMDRTWEMLSFTFRSFWASLSALLRSISGVVLFFIEGQSAKAITSFYCTFLFRAKENYWLYGLIYSFRIYSAFFWTLYYGSTLQHSRKPHAKVGRTQKFGLIFYWFVQFRGKKFVSDRPLRAWFIRDQSSHFNSSCLPLSRERLSRAL